MQISAARIFKSIRAIPTHANAITVDYLIKV